MKLKITTRVRKIYLESSLLFISSELYLKPALPRSVCAYSISKDKYVSCIAVTQFE